MEGIPGSGAPSPTPPSIAATAQIQQAFPSFAQVYEAFSGPASVETGQRTDTSIQRLESEQTQTRASLRSTQEALSAIGRDVATCNASHHELQRTISRQASHIATLERVVGGLRTELTQHLGRIRHTLSQFESRVASAHTQLDERVNYQLGQQTAKIDAFQTRFVAPLFASMHQTLMMEAIGSRSAAVPSSQPASEQTVVLIPTESMQQQTSKHAVSDCVMKDTTSIPGPSRSQSADSDTPLAEVHMAQLAGPSVARAAEQGSEAQNLTTTTAVPISESRGQATSQSARVTHDASPAPEADSTRQPNDQSKAIAEPSVLPAQSLEARELIALNRIHPLPSPSPSLSPSSRHSSAPTTSLTFQSSSLALAAISQDKPTTPSAHDVADGADAADPGLKRKRTPSIECVGVQMAKKLIRNERLRGTAASTSTVNERAGQSPDAPSTTAADTASSFPAWHTAARTKTFATGAVPGSVASNIDLARARCVTQDPRRTPSTPSATSVPTTQSKAPVQSRKAQSTDTAQTSQVTAQSNQLQKHSGSSSKTSASSSEHADKETGPSLSANLTTSRDASSSARPNSAQRAGQPLQEAQTSNELSSPRSILGELELSGPALNAKPASSQHISNKSTAKNVPACGPQHQEGVTKKAETEIASTSRSEVTLELIGEQLLELQQLQIQRARAKTVCPPPAKPKSTEQANVAISEHGVPAEGIQVFDASRKQPKTFASLAREPQEHVPSTNKLVTSDTRSQARDQLDYSLSSENSDQFSCRLRDHEGSSTRQHQGRIERAPGQSRIDWLASLKDSPPRGGHDQPYFIWAWLGPVKKSISDLSDAASVLIAPNDLVVESLIAESLASDLIRGKRANILDSGGSSQWLELDLSWLYDRQCAKAGQGKRCDVTHVRFLIVPTKHMPTGISLGSGEMRRLQLEIVPGPKGSRPHLCAAGTHQPYRSLMELRGVDRHLHSPKPFERLCTLAGEAVRVQFRNGVSKSAEPYRTGSRDGIDFWQDSRKSHVTAPKTPPRDHGRIGTMAGTSTSSEAPRWPRRPSEANTNASTEASSGQRGGVAETGSAAPSQRTHRRDTPHPAPVTRDEAQMLRARWETEREKPPQTTIGAPERPTLADRLGTMLDSGSPLTDTGSPAFEAPEEEEVDELADE